MVNKKTEEKTAKTEAAPAAAEKKPAKKKKDPVTTKPKSEYIGENLAFAPSGEAKGEGLCIGERDTPSGKQVLIKLADGVSRYYNVSDLKK